MPMRPNTSMGGKTLHALIGKTDFYGAIPLPNGTNDEVENVLPMESTHRRIQIDPMFECSYL